MDTSLNLEETLKSVCEIVAIVGPMFSGKTSEGLSSLYVRKTMGYTTMYITFVEDNRYDISTNGVYTHDGVCNTDKIDYVVKTHNLMDVDLTDINCICIDEAQFFDDLIKFIDKVRYNFIGTIYVCGLLGDYKMDKFGHISDILHLCSNIIFKTSCCMVCNRRKMRSAPFSSRKDDQLEVTVKSIGGSEKYYSSCLKHHKY